MIQATFRALPIWPHPITRDRRSAWTFKAPWSSTLELLDREIRTLDGRSVIIGAGFQERDLRLDGWPRSDARMPSHPGVEISFDSRHGRLVYATDVCSFWEHNVRSIALGLGALRAVDRYGVSRRGEQYAGWRALPAGTALGPGVTLEEAQSLLAALSSMPLSDIQHWVSKGGNRIVHLESAYRRALKQAHPDTGGDAEKFRLLQSAWDLIKGAVA